MITLQATKGKGAYVQMERRGRAQRWGEEDAASPSAAGEERDLEASKGWKRKAARGSSDLFAAALNCFELPRKKKRIKAELIGKVDSCCNLLYGYIIFTRCNNSVCQSVKIEVNLEEKYW